MARCHRMQEQLTAWIDGELSPRRAERVRTHLATCPCCAVEAESLRAAVAWQRDALTRVVAVEPFNATPLRVQVQRMLADVDALPVEREWRWWLTPAVLASAAVAVGFSLLLWVAGGPETVLVPLGVESPPPAVSRQPDLFRDYTLIQHLDALENFDTVEAVPLDDDQAQRG